MGMQSALVARLRVHVSTTYITGTWTAVSTWAAGRLRRSNEAADRSRAARTQVAVVVCYFLAALAAGCLFRVAGGAVAAIPAGAVGLVSLALVPRRRPRVTAILAEHYPADFRVGRRHAGRQH
jgi:uncharacterized membrane protein YoaK (UPF0700 family)